MELSYYTDCLNRGNPSPVGLGVVRLVKESCYKQNQKCGSFSVEAY